MKLVDRLHRGTPTRLKLNDGDDLSANISNRWCPDVPVRLQ
ncbi:hypothetical protein [Mesorhizobium sp. WSM3864]|nr:hypothetical protein [Mesorhizobium sp. WSM3864]